MADPLVGTTFHFDAPAPQPDQAPRGGLGSQVLPVADLDDDFQGDPEDGSQYLALVRREAASRARINRVENPYETMQDEVEREVAEVPSSRPSEAWREVFVRNFQAARQRMIAAPVPSLPPVDPATFPPPRDEGLWRVFVNGKRAKVKPPPVTANPALQPPVPSAAKSTPVSQPEDVEMNDLEAAKAAILASLEIDTPEPTTSPILSSFPKRTAGNAPPPDPAPAPAQTPEYERLPQLPSPALVAAIPGPHIIHVLSHFTDWFNERTEAYEEALNFVPSTIFAPPSLRRKGASSATARKPSPSPAAAKKPPPKPPLPTAHEAHWLLSLLTRLDRLLDGDDLANLRQLAKTLAQLAETSAQKQEVAKGGRSMEKRQEEDEEEEGRARCWMAVAAIAGVWAQGDLWDTSL
ncbi:hypothetical protein JCM11641_004252 [Rhodosporidiobolus odoratus]